MNDVARSSGTGADGETSDIVSPRQSTSKPSATFSSSALRDSAEPTARHCTLHNLRCTMRNALAMRTPPGDSPATAGGRRGGPLGWRAGDQTQAALEEEEDAR
ncbi:hypothetical protein GCM10025787_04920 [Saccharopolyspora rosea]